MYLILSFVTLTYSRFPPQYRSYDDLYILPLIEVNKDDSVYQLYVSTRCPFAKEIEEELLNFINIHQHQTWLISPPNEYFPSPTLRIKSNESYQNYRGVKKIKEAILSFKY